MGNLWKQFFSNFRFSFFHFDDFLLLTVCVKCCYTSYLYLRLFVREKRSFYKPNKIVLPLYVHNKISNRLRSQSSLLIEIAEAIIFEKSQNISLSKNVRKTYAIISIKKSKKTYSLSYSRNLKFCPVLAARQLSDLSKKRARRSRRLEGAHLNPISPYHRMITRSSRENHVNVHSLSWIQCLPTFSANFNNLSGSHFLAVNCDQIQ